MKARHRTYTVFPITIAEFVACMICTALSIYVIGAVMGVRWIG